MFSVRTLLALAVSGMVILASAPWRSDRRSNVIRRSPAREDERSTARWRFRGRPAESSARSRSSGRVVHSSGRCKFSGRRGAGDRQPEGRGRAWLGFPGRWWSAPSGLWIWLTGSADAELLVRRRGRGIGWSGHGGPAARRTGGQPAAAARSGRPPDPAAAELPLQPPQGRRLRAGKTARPPRDSFPDPRLSSTTHRRTYGSPRRLRWGNRWLGIGDRA